MTATARVDLDGRLEIERGGVLMSADPDDPREAEGVLNPASARDRDGVLWLFPRMVAAGNRSCIGRVRVIEDEHGPTGVERHGIAIEPDQPWEQNRRTAGTEDPRVSFVAELDAWVMCYTAYGPLGPRIAIATSNDLVTWQKHGPVDFEFDRSLGTDLNLYRNKDAAIFPELVTDPDGHPALALLHRPMWELDDALPGSELVMPTAVHDARPSIWISFLPAKNLPDLRHWRSHRQLAQPEFAWEALKIGGGPPPVRTSDGWLVLHHGVTGESTPGVDQQQHVHYGAGALLLDLDDVTTVRGRTRMPLLEPEADDERSGIVPNVVFPTAIEPRGTAWDVFYGMADDKVGHARLIDHGRS